MSIKAYWLESAWSVIGHLVLGVLILFGSSSETLNSNYNATYHARPVMRVTAWRGNVKPKAAASAKAVKNATLPISSAATSRAKPSKASTKTLSKVQAQPNELNKHVTRYQDKTAAKATKPSKKAADNPKIVIEEALTVAATVNDESLDLVAGVNDPISGFQQAIMQTIAYFWKQPANLNADDFCTYLVALSSNGSIVTIKLDQSSGNAALERSAKAAIQAAEPLPVPEQQKLYEHFKELRLIFRGNGSIGGN